MRKPAPRCMNACLAAVLAAVAASSALAQAESAEVLLRRVRKGHPRLMLLEEDVPALRRKINTDATLKRWYESVRHSAEKTLKKPCVTYERRDRGFLLDIMLGRARQAVDRMYTLGLVYRLEGDERFARRGVQELLQASSLKSWNPKHFLDTAELTHAVALGYDWFYKCMTPAERRKVRDAICSLGLRAGASFYRSNFYWASANHNWNQVCNGGMTIGALAVADERPELAGYVLQSAMRSINVAMAEFAPDGGWAEGPGYWSYATQYNVYFLAALESAMGKDAIEPYLRKPGFDKTGLFRIHMSGPLGKSFNFADAGEGVGDVPQMFWLARKFSNPDYAWHAARHASGSPEDILWHCPPGKSPSQSRLPLDALFRHVETVFFRSAWEDEKAVYIGFKGGDNTVNHGHLDLGTFVLDAGGVRWALDLGGDNYSLPGYFVIGKNRYYRLKTVGHNCLLINGGDQRIDSRARVVAFSSAPQRASAVVDLSEPYAGQADRVARGIALIGRRRVLVQDEFSLPGPAEVTWQMHTRAQATLSGRSALLQSGEQRLYAEILSPQGASFSTQEAKAPPPQAQQPDVRKLTVSIQLPKGDHRIAVLLSPGQRPGRVDLAPLSGWPNQAARMETRPNPKE